MPELPEGEITRRGIEPHLRSRVITDVVVRQRGLRWPVDPELRQRVVGRRIDAVHRRAKYLLLECEGDHLILHLGMSGSLRIVDREEPPGTWDHVDIVIGPIALRLRDPRRFGAVLWHEGEIGSHALLANLGVEPLSSAFHGELLHGASRGRSVAVKLLLMNHAIVVGVGNIYANESLFVAGIDPRVAARRISRARYDKLAEGVRETLLRALAEGGSTLRDFMHPDGGAGHFQSSYFVYDRVGAPCRACGTPISRLVQGQRSTFYCPSCQRR